MAGIRIHWWHVKKGIVVDDARLPALTQLLLRSEHHQRPPDGYQIFEVLPKLLGVLPRRARWVGDFGATPSSAPWSSVCWSDQIWGLSGPKIQGAEAVYVPRIDDVRVRLDTPAPRIRCADIFIDRMEQKSGWEAVLQPEVEVKGPSAGEATVASVGAKIGRFGVERGKKIGFIGRTASDPAVQVDLLQGDSLLEFLRAWGQTYEEADPTPEAPWDVLKTYANGLTIEQEPDGSSYGFGPDTPLRADVVVPQEDGSKGAFALRIRSLEDERLAISAPVFFNGVEGRVVVTDIPPEMLPTHYADLLGSLDTSALARGEGPEEDNEWQEIVAAVDGLGTDSVEEAVALLRSMGTSAGGAVVA